MSLLLLFAPALLAGTGHRYWQLYIQSSASFAAAMAEVQFRVTPGTPLLFSGGIASASTSYGSQTADLATDNNPATSWSSSANAVGTTWQYTYANGSAPSIAEVTITARNDGYESQAPTAFLVQYSDDGTTWTTAWSVSSTATWTSGQTQVFTNPSAVVPASPALGPMLCWLD